MQCACAIWAHLLAANYREIQNTVSKGQNWIKPLLRKEALNVEYLWKSYYFVYLWLYRLVLCFVAVFLAKLSYELRSVNGLSWYRFSRHWQQDVVCCFTFDRCELISYISRENAGKRLRKKLPSPRVASPLNFMRALDRTFRSPHRHLQNKRLPAVYRDFKISRFITIAYRPYKFNLIIIETFSCGLFVVLSAKCIYVP